VEALLRSGAHAYVEFKAVECVAVLSGGALRPVPASRAEVFASPHLSATDKRALMRALKAGGDGDGPFADGAADFGAALAGAGLGPWLSDALAFGVALQEARGGSCAAGAAALRRYLGSLGRFAGAGALLAPLYGSSELPQAFCRAAAVAGATHVLRRAARALLLDASGAVSAVRTAGGQELRCGRLAAGRGVWARLAPAAQPCSPRTILRAACIVDASLLEGRAQMLAVIPPGSLPCGGPPAAVRVLQYGPSACVVPEGRHVLHFSMRLPCAPAAAGEPRAALWPSLQALLETGEGEGGDEAGARPRLRWAVFYAQEEEGEEEGGDDWLPPNGALCTGAGGALDICASVTAAEAAFGRLYPGLPFFAPSATAAGAEGEEEGEDAEMALLQEPVVTIP